MATLSPHDRFTAIQTGWCWTREGRSLKPYTTSAASSRALRCPWAPKRTPPGSVGTSWTVSRRWLMVRGPVGSEKRPFLSPGWGWRVGVGGSRRSWGRWSVQALAHPGQVSVLREIGTRAVIYSLHKQSLIPNTPRLVLPAGWGYSEKH